MGCSCSKDLLADAQQPESSSSAKKVSPRDGDSRRATVLDAEGNASHDEPLRSEKEGSLPLHHPRRGGPPLPLSTTPTRSTSAKQGHEGSAMKSSSRTPTTGRGPRGSPSTPSTVDGEDDEDDEDDERDEPDAVVSKGGTGRRQAVPARRREATDDNEGAAFAVDDFNDDEMAASTAGGTTTVAATSLGGGTLLEDPSEHYESDAEDQRFSQVKDDIQQDLQHLFDLEQEVKLESRKLIHDIDHSSSTHLDDDCVPTPPPPPVVNVLLTGDDAGYLMKLLRLTSGPAYTRDERGAFRDAIRSNVVDDVRGLCRNLRDSDFESFLVYHEDEHDAAQQQKEQDPPPDLFDTLQLFGQLRNAWQDIRANGGEDAGSPKDKAKQLLKPREAFDILVSMLIGEDDDEGDDPTKENVDLYEEERESIDDAKLFLHLWREIQTLWQSDELREFLAERPWLLQDSLLFHLSIMEDLARIADPDYSVTDEDILDASSSNDASTCECCTVPYENVVFNVTCLSLSYVDQHGLQGVEGPHILAFVASLTGFDQTQGDEGVNKMMRSVGSLRTLCSVDEVQRDCVTCVILTKQDLFAEKMRYSDVAAIADFEDFEGESGDTDGAFDYFIDKFQNCLAKRSDDLVVPFDAEEYDVATVLYDHAKRLQFVAAHGVAASRAVVAEQPKATTMADDQPIPSPAIEVTCAADGEEFYTETIEV